jgi:predicted RNA polymerase sigma factor
MTFEVSGADRVEGLLRELAPRVIGTLVRRHGQFDLCEDAVQEALLAAAVQWPQAGIPQHPRGWLVTVASRRLTDQVRTERARRRREETVVARSPAGQLVAPAPDADLPSAHDDTLTLLFLCCRPALSPASQVAAGARFAPPPPEERADRLRVVLRVLYLIFNEGYAASSGPHLQRAELTAEAIRLAKELHRLLPDDGEVAGQLALMLLTDARRPARSLPDGSLVPLASQDRSRWDAAAREHYRAAARRTTSLPERRYLEGRAARLEP